jgi:hypothetical protein
MPRSFKTLVTGDEDIIHFTPPVEYSGGEVFQKIALEIELARK